MTMSRRAAALAALIAAAIAPALTGIAASAADGEFTLHIVSFPDDAGAVYAVTHANGEAAGADLRAPVGSRLVSGPSVQTLVDLEETDASAWTVVGGDEAAGEQDAEDAAAEARPDFVRIKDVDAASARAFIADIPMLNEPERARLRAALGL